MEDCGMKQKLGMDETMGQNIQALRLAHGVTLQSAADAMCSLGHSWSKTTLFNIEHNTRRLLASEAFDLLSCLGYNPEKDLMLIYGQPRPSIDYVIHRCQQAAEKIRSSKPGKPR